MNDLLLLSDYARTFALPEGRSFQDLFDAFERASTVGVQPAVDVRQERVHDRDGWRLTVDVATPRTAGPHPLAVYLHGGGWVSGNPAGYRRVSCELAARGFAVVTPDYRRAPRHRFPAALDDCRAVVEWASARAGALGATSDRPVLAGDSAGANLAATTALSEGVDVRGLLLFYGIYDYHSALPRLGPLVGGTAAADQLYLPVDRFEELRGDPRVSPLVVAHDLPATFVAVGELDPLLEQSLELAGALAVAGVPHELKVYPSAPHSFLQLPTTPAFEAAYDDAARFARTVD